MAPADIEDQSPNQQEVDEGNTDHGPRYPDPCFTIVLKGFKYLTYPLALAMYTSFAALPIGVIAQSGAINPDSIAKGTVAFLFSLPFIAMVLFSLPKKMTGIVKEVPRSPEAQGLMAGIYIKSRCKQTIFKRVLNTSVGFLARAGLLLVVWLALTVRVAKLKRLTLLGSPLWAWSLLAVTVTVGYFQALAIYVIPSTVWKVTSEFDNVTRRQKQQVATRRVRIPHEYYYSGLFPTTTMVIYFGMVLLAWLLYFRIESGLKHASIPHSEAFQYVTWTIVSLFVGALLFFCKTLVLLKWSANAIYRRFQPRILITAVKYLYLGLIVGKFFTGEIITELQVLEECARQSEPAKFNFTQYIMSKDMDVSYLVRVGRILTSLATVVRAHEEDGVPLVVEFFEKVSFSARRSTDDDKCEREDLVELLSCDDLSPPKAPFRIPVERLPRLIIGAFQKKVARSAENVNATDARNIPSKPEKVSPEEYRMSIANVLYGIVREQESSSTENKFITLDVFKKSMVDAHINCVNMGRTLADARAIVTRLDIFISLIILFVVALFWLLITGIATTKVLVTIATPLLALTFIFGDSAKSFFQGIIFCFATHAFDVGDRCILDDTELEVKSMGILTTTFIKIGSTEKRLYPNSVLATKAIVNLGWQPDPSDTIELTLDISTTPTDWTLLERKISQFFNEPEQRKFFESSHEVTMKEMGDKIKVTIHFKHVLNIKEMTHGQCFLKKNRQRSIILKRINYFLDNKSLIENDDTRRLVNSKSCPGLISISLIRRVR